MTRVPIKQAPIKRARRRVSTVICAALLFSATAADAHVGSPDVYADGNAGPYRLSIVLRPPMVIPGVTEIEVRAETPGIDGIAITPIPLTGEASHHPPVPDAMVRPSNDAQFFTGHLWIMATGSWQIRFQVSGKQGAGQLSIPLPATALATKKMQPALGVFLAFLGIVLVLGMIGIVGAAAREAKLAPGTAPQASGRRSGRIAMAAAAVFLIAGVVLGNVWWKAEAADYSGYVYKPLQMTPHLQTGNVLGIKLHDPGWLSQRKLDDFILDHNHLMHLYMIRWPQMDVVFHLHPEAVETGKFELALPSMPAGDYHLYADVVHANGFPETIVGSIDLPQISGRALAGDDAKGAAKPVDSASPGGSAQPAAHNADRTQRFSLPDGYTMIWHEPDALVPKAPESFRFELVDAQGKPPADMALYMGMLGHAAFVKTDGSVFAHIHPNGTVAMAAFMMANTNSPAAMGGAAASQSISSMAMPGMNMPASALPNSVSFPYGFPSPGDYRIFVQMKHGATVETGIFDAQVQASK